MTPVLFTAYGIAETLTVSGKNARFRDAKGMR